VAPSLGVLTEDDVAGALALGDVLGWNKTADDWTRIIRLSPAGCFAAREGSGLVGTITTTAYGQTLAWIGMMIVHPDRQRRGIGAALMEDGPH
jgi:GNAT superfamily N-acetyltransferase